MNGQNIASALENYALDSKTTDCIESQSVRLYCQISSYRPDLTSIRRVYSGIFRPVPTIKAAVRALSKLYSTMLMKLH